MRRWPSLAATRPLPPINSSPPASPPVRADFEASLQKMRSEKKAMDESFAPSADILATGEGLDIDVSAAGIADKLDALLLDK